MIADIFLFILGQIITFITGLLPAWHIWPDTLLTGITYFCGVIAKLNFLLPIDSLFAVILFIIDFEIAYLGVKLLMKLANYIRGTGSGLDI